MKLRLLSVALVALVAVLAGCGGGKKSSPPATTGGSTANAASFANTSNCARMAGLEARIAQDVGTPSGNLQTDVANEAAALQTLANAAPAQIHGDLETFATAFDNFLRALNDAGLKAGKVPTAGQLAKLETAAKTLETPKLRTAEQHLATWAQTNCGKG
jgi:hypothetical protein